jgi:hypothetical protein
VQPGSFDETIGIDQAFALSAAQQQQLDDAAEAAEEAEAAKLAQERRNEEARRFREEQEQARQAEARRREEDRRQSRANADRVKEGLYGMLKRRNE